MSKKFTIYDGKFICHGCKAEVPTARFWKSQVELTWKCRECENVSQVDLYVRGY